MVDADAGRVLLAKYNDWRSARLAAAFVQLTPEQIYELAQDADDEELESGDGESPAARSSAGLQLTYPLIVKRVTKVLEARRPLPTFDEWLEAYEDSPGRFDEEIILGLWRES